MSRWRMVGVSPLTLAPIISYVTWEHGDLVRSEEGKMCHGEHRPLFPPQLVVTVATPTLETVPLGRAPRLRLLEGRSPELSG